jgi:hypothetical protein
VERADRRIHRGLQAASLAGGAGTTAKHRTAKHFVASNARGGPSFSMMEDQPNENEDPNPHRMSIVDWRGSKLVGFTQ